MANHVDSISSIWSSSGNPAKFVQSGSYKVIQKDRSSCGSKRSDFYNTHTAPFAVPVVNSLCSINGLESRCHLHVTKENAQFCDEPGFPSLKNEQKKSSVLSKIANKTRKSSSNSLMREILDCDTNLDDIMTGKFQGKQNCQVIELLHAVHR